MCYWEQFRTPEEKMQDEKRENSDHLCSCGHDLDDEHQRIDYPHWPTLLVCDVCDVGCQWLGEREQFEERVRRINELAKKNLGMK